jgi:putative DNA primase/helicase
MDAHTQPPTDPWAQGARASSVPAKKLDLSRTLFPPEPDDTRHYLEYGAKHYNDNKRSNIDFGDVRTAAQNNIDYVLRESLPKGNKKGDEWVALNPTRNDRNPGSFSVNMHTGCWHDRATGDGGDLIRLWAYVRRLSTDLDAIYELAEFLRTTPRGSTDRSLKSSNKAFGAADKPVPGTATPAESRVKPTSFPPRTPPKDGKPFFVVAGDQGPPIRSDEKRRHVYCQGGVPVRIKIIKKDKKGAVNAYRVTGADGVTGWQFAKPEGFLQIPYFVANTNPFAATINQPIFWVEGEKDVDTLAALGGLAFTFGGCGDGIPHGCEQYTVGRPVVILADNDDEGRKHADANRLRLECRL